jgi:hypothetical protein
VKLGTCNPSRMMCVSPIVLFYVEPILLTLI